MLVLFLLDKEDMYGYQLRQEVQGAQRRVLPNPRCIAVPHPIQIGAERIYIRARGDNWSAVAKVLSSWTQRKRTPDWNFGRISQAAESNKNGAVQRWFGGARQWIKVETTQGIADLKFIYHQYEYFQSIAEARTDVRASISIYELYIILMSSNMEVSSSELISVSHWLLLPAK